MIVSAFTITHRLTEEQMVEIFTNEDPVLSNSFLMCAGYASNVRIGRDYSTTDETPTLWFEYDETNSDAAASINDVNASFEDLLAEDLLGEDLSVNDVADAEVCDVADAEVCDEADDAIHITMNINISNGDGGADDLHCSCDLCNCA